MTLPVEQWGRRLGETLWDALGAGDFDAARRLALEGDGQTRDLAREYTFMIRGLAITVEVMLPLLRETAARRASGEDGATTALGELVHRFRADLARQHGLASTEKGALDREIAAAGRVLADSRSRCEHEQARLADAVVDAIERRDAARARMLMQAREADSYLPYHDLLLRFMARGFAWVLEWFGPDELLRFHLATAERQRAGFEKWERMPAADFARITAFLLKQHMGNVTVAEDAEKFTIEQTPCGSGGRLRLAGDYEGAHALPFVENPGPLTFGGRRLPVYCSHCAIWNGAATLRWFGRAQWVFDHPSREDGSCTLHIYKTPGYTPRDYVARVAVPEGAR